MPGLDLNPDLDKPALGEPLQLGLFPHNQGISCHGNSLTMKEIIKRKQAIYNMISF